MSLLSKHIGLSPDTAWWDRLSPHRAARRLSFAREPGWQFSLMLMLQFVFLFVAIPILSFDAADRNVVALLQLALAVVTIALVAQAMIVRIGLAASFGLTLMARLLPGLLPSTTTLAMLLAYNALVTAVMARAVFGPGEVNHHRISGAIFIYLNVPVLFALAYSALVLMVPDALSGFGPTMHHRMATMLHYSFTTYTSIGNNQIAPASPAARSLADLEAIIGHLFPAVLLSRLVGLHVSKTQPG